MTNRAIIDKYDILYTGGTELAFRIKLCNPDEIEGASDDEIQAFCNQHNVTLPPALWSYTRHFGKKTRTRDSDYNCGYTLQNYEYALHQASLRGEWTEMMNAKELLFHKNFKVNYDNYSTDNEEGLYTPEINSLMNVDDILFFSYDEFTRSFKFLDSSKENSATYYLTKYDTLSSTFLSLTNRYRDVLFSFILDYAPQDFAEMGFVKGKRVSIAPPPTVDYSNGFECLKIYQEIFKSKKLDRARLTKLRLQFYALNDEVEKKENKISSFTNFENDFIKYITKNELVF